LRITMEDPMIMTDVYTSAARTIASASHLTAFTGAGISVESGIPPFRGTGGLYGHYDQRTLDIGYFTENPEKSWESIREIFYENFAGAEPNGAHLFLAELEKAGRLKALVTQNIDDLHYRAGSRNVAEFHGNSRRLLCTSCGARVDAELSLMKTLPPRCRCGGIYKPDFVFFGEGIPSEAFQTAIEAASSTDCMIIIGSTGEVYPAASIPQQAKRAGATIIEINPEPSNFTSTTTDIFIQDGAVSATTRLRALLAM
jgi:NAD-dependent deacetylase